MDTTDGLGMDTALRAMMREVTSAQPGAPVRPGRPHRAEPRTAAARRITARLLRVAADRVEPRRRQVCTPAA